MEVTQGVRGSVLPWDGKGSAWEERSVGMVGSRYWGREGSGVEFERGVVEGECMESFVFRVEGEDGFWDG